MDYSFWTGGSAFTPVTTGNAYFGGEMKLSLVPLPIPVNFGIRANVKAMVNWDASGNGPNVGKDFALMLQAGVAPDVSLLGGSIAFPLTKMANVDCGIYVAYKSDADWNVAVRATVKTGGAGGLLGVLVDGISGMNSGAKNALKDIFGSSRQASSLQVGRSRVDAVV